MLYYLMFRANKVNKPWGISTVGSALHSHCRGQRFESAMLHHKKKPLILLESWVLFFIGNCKKKSRCDKIEDENITA